MSPDPSGVRSFRAAVAAFHSALLGATKPLVKGTAVRSLAISCTRSSGPRWATAACNASNSFARYSSFSAAVVLTTTTTSRGPAALAAAGGCKLRAKYVVPSGCVKQLSRAASGPGSAANVVAANARRQRCTRQHCPSQQKLLRHDFALQQTRREAALANAVFRSSGEDAQRDFPRQEPKKHALSDYASFYSTRAGFANQKSRNCPAKWTTGGLRGEDIRSPSPSERGWG